MDFSQLEWVLWRKRSRWEIRVLEKKTLDSFPLAHTVPFILYSSFSHPLTMGLQKGWKIGYSLLKWVIWHPLNKAVNTNSRVHGHQQDGLFECRFGDPCGLTAMLPPGLSSLTLQSQFLENGYPPPCRKEAGLNNAIFVAAEHQWPCSVLGPNWGERRERPAVKRSICFRPILSYHPEAGSPPWLLLSGIDAK